MLIEIRALRKFSSRVSRARLGRVARRAMRAENVDAALTIYITDDSEIRALNRKFHATNAATDVLSFPTPRLLREGVERPYLGDVVISYERARVQAHAAGWRIVNELELLAVHGILHLLGYDDIKPGARKKMWAKQKEILGRVIRET